MRRPVSERSPSGRPGRALSLGSQRQINLHARNLQGIGQHDRALAIFHDNFARDRDAASETIAARTATRFTFM